jgi:dTDP-4-dehydrorhamnose reductase
VSELELWAGVECSVVRVRERYVDQIARTGHASRLDDLDRLAALGARAVRYPVLWERTAPDGVERADWTFADERLAHLRRLGLRPIVGLVHHGSGPRHTSLLESSFIAGLARFARCVAERYPWIEDFTPVNEPLTTARFSALYGHWYPHERTEAAFTRALLVQCEAIRAAMEAIREVTPHARLVQTEDIATVFSTPSLAYQATFENRRRFLSLDLLTGGVTKEHALRAHLEGAGAPADVLESFVERPCPPQVVGLNYYVTSDRFLDERVASYPVHVRGGNTVDTYADVEAVRVRGSGITGHRALLGLLWDRYRLPLAITEVHLGCVPEEQIRWLDEAWHAANEARSAGIDVRAVTAWSSFGACEWDSLVTEERGSYESGLHDVRGGFVRPTALAGVAADLAARGRSEHPLLGAPGWWRRPARIVYPVFGELPSEIASPCMPPIVVTGARGTLGAAFVHACAARGLRVVALARPELDVTDRTSVARVLGRLRPWAIVNAAGYVRVDDAERERGACMRVNTTGPLELARACAARGIRLVTFSSDLVFDGAKRAAYVESDATGPLGVYGESKREAERVVLDLLPSALVIRTSAFFGPWDLHNFVHLALERLEAGMTMHAATDLVVSPTYVPDLVEAALTLLVDGAEGLWHLANAGAVSWADLARCAAQRAGISTASLVGCPSAALALAACRPTNSALTSERGAMLPPLEEALARYVADRKSDAFMRTA